MEAKFLKDLLQYGNNQVLTNKQELKKKTIWLQFNLN